MHWWTLPDRSRTRPADGMIADRARIGLAAARRAARVSGPRRPLSYPLIIEVEPRENIAAGRFGWGLGPWAPPGTVRRVIAEHRQLAKFHLD